jgi:hypothetical protein
MASRPMVIGCEHSWFAHLIFLLIGVFDFSEDPEVNVSREGWDFPGAFFDS